MTKITLKQFGPTTHLAAAEIIDENGQIGAYVAEPEARDICATGDGGWYPGEGWDENAFRAAVEAEVRGWEPRYPGEKLWIQYDPGRNHASEVEVELRG